ncbi:MAG: flavodoxin domain-containing protein [Pseudomonadota bacterium]
MRLNFLYGTESSTAELLCDDLQAAVEEGNETSIANMEDVDASTLEAEPLYILVSSTYGNGEVPASAEEFYKTLTEQKPDLSHVRFAIFGLGDTSFDETFNHGSEKIMNAMVACGAKMIGERGVFDASSGDMPEDVGVPWLEGIVKLEGAAA